MFGKDQSLYVPKAAVGGPSGARGRAPVGDDEGLRQGLDYGDGVK